MAYTLQAHETALGARALVIKAVRRQTAPRRNEKGVSVKVVSGRLQRLTDRIISNGDGREKGSEARGHP